MFLSVATFLSLSLPTLFSQALGSHVPVVIWHGMGDSCCNEESMGYIQQLIEAKLPGVYVYSIDSSFTGDEREDRKSSFFGSFSQQVETVCGILKGDSQLSSGFNALGFSQGGQALRAYVQRCNDPPVLNLITFGSQHMGVSDAPNCMSSSSEFSTELSGEDIEAQFDDTIDILLDSGDGGVSLIADSIVPNTPHSFWCNLVRSIIQRGAYTKYAQSSIIQAQYYRDPYQIPEYLESNHFLADINNEKEVKNETYVQNLSALNRFVMIMFEEDTQVVPKESSWFWFYRKRDTDSADDDEDGYFADDEGDDSAGLDLVPLDESEFYLQDWIGLRKLKEAGKLDFLTCPGGHMSLSEDYLDGVFEKYLKNELPHSGDVDIPPLVLQVHG